MAQEVLQLRAIEAVSPTLAETLRLCKLRAGLSRAENISQYVLGNPKAWLGIAYHEALEAVGFHQRNDLKTRVREAWDSAIQHQHDRSRAHPFDKRFGPPEFWPGYHLIAEMALVRAKELVGAAASQNDGTSSGHARGETLREKKFSAAGGKIVGRPDVVRPEEVVDFKTGEVFEDNDHEEVKNSHVRQLRLYAFLVWESLGWWPRRGILLPMTGSAVEVYLEPEECEGEAKSSVRLLDEYNDAIARAVTPDELASPSPTSCRWCQYPLYCQAFWRLVESTWADDLRSGAIEGRATGAARPIHGGSALSLSLRVERGTVPAGTCVSLFPLDPSVHPDVARVKAGDGVRVTGLWQRADDSVVATNWTMIALERSLPALSVLENRKSRA